MSDWLNGVVVAAIADKMENKQQGPAESRS